MEEKTKRKKILANRVYSDATLKKWKKEDLIEQIRILEHNWATAEEALNNSAKNSEKLLSEQKAEIERLKDEKYKVEQNLKQCENGYELELHTARFELREARKELEKFEDMRDKAIETCDNCHKKYAKKIEQTKKYTAKEIFDLLHYTTMKKSEIEKRIAERYGVEVK